jgi:NAD(P)H dehydrogenase (quinone)
MYAVMGITGQVGSAVAASLIDRGEKVRGIVRDPAKAAGWESRGVELVVADYDDAKALGEAFRGTDGVFAMIPPNFAPSPDFAEVRRTIGAVREALLFAAPPKVVSLSSIGAQQATGLGLITSLHMLEEALSSLPVANAFLRAGWFMENSQWDIASAREEGRFFSYLQPLDRSFPLVATADIGRVGADVLLQSWSGNRAIEVDGPRSYTPREIASALGAVVHREVEAVAVPREEWVGNFVAQGTPADRTAHRIAMLEGFNSGWIGFGVPGAEHVKGTVELESVLQQLAAKQASAG